MVLPFCLLSVGAHSASLLLLTLEDACTWHLHISNFETLKRYSSDTFTDLSPHPHALAQGVSLCRSLMLSKHQALPAFAEPRG